MRCWRTVLIGLVCVWFCLSAGCGSSATGGRKAVSGTVTFKNQPLDQGIIEFGTGEGQPPLSGSTIENGKFAIPAEKGLKPGTYRVAILASTVASAPSPDELPGEAPPAIKQRIPAKYNEKSTLQAEIKESGENVLEFKLD